MVKYNYYELHLSEEKSNEIENRIRTLPRFNHQNSIRRIPKSIFDLVVDESLPNNLLFKGFESSQRNWLMLTKANIEEIVSNVIKGSGEQSKRLSIDPEIVKRIIYHLISSKHVILVGPPGTGKTDLARRLLHELGTRIIGIRDPIEAVASYEWGRYDVIGGNSLIPNNTGNKFSFHYCIIRHFHPAYVLITEEGINICNREVGTQNTIQ